MSWIFYSLISAFFSATSAIVQKKVLFKESALIFSTYLSLFTFLLSFIFISEIDFSSLTQANLLFFIIKSLINAFGFFCVMYGIKNLDISKALPLLALTPGILAIAGFFSFNETLLLNELIGLILLLIGTCILEFKRKFFHKNFYHKGHLAIILALSFMSASAMMDRYIVHYQSISPKTFIFFHQGFMFFLFFSVLLVGKLYKKNSFKLKLQSNFKWITLIAIMTLLYRYTNLLAVASTSAALALALKRTSVFFATVIGGKIFKEQSLLKRAFAVILILLGSIILNTKF